MFHTGRFIILGLFLDFDGFLIAHQECLKPLQGVLEIVFDGTFPEGCYAKSLQRELPAGLDVAYGIVRELLVPEFGIALRATRELAAVLVPKATVYEDDNSVFEYE